MSGGHKVILFATTNHTLRGEKVLKRAGLQAKVVPVPRHLSSDCGISLRIPADQEAQALSAMTAANLPHEAIHPH